jgi:hypothetical protein
MLSQNFKKIALIFLAVLGLSSLVKYNFLLSDKEDKVEENAQKINAILSENFEQAERIMILAGRKIALNNPDLDPKLIYKVFNETTNIGGLSNIFSWTLLDWVDNDGYQKVSTLIGIRKDPPRLGLERNYIHHGNELWKITFSEPAIGVPSGIRIIPIGVPIDTKSYSLAGVITAGISIKKLSNIIEATLDPDICFMIIDRRNSKFVLGSYDLEKYQDNTFNTIPKLINNQHYIYKKDMEVKFPYEIWVGYDQRQFWHEVLYSSLLLTIQTIGIALCIASIKVNSNKKTSN